MLTHGAPNWRRLVTHLGVKAWSFLCQEQLTPRSASYWKVEIKRLYIEYLSYPTVFESVRVNIVKKGTNRQTTTALDNETFVGLIIDMLTLDLSDSMLPLVRTRTLAIIEERLHLLSSAHGLDFIRQATQWKGIDQGYTAFHHYEDVNSTNIFARPQKVFHFENPLIQSFLQHAFSFNSEHSFAIFVDVCPANRSFLLPLEKLNPALMEFGSAAFLAGLCLTTKARRVLNARWKIELLDYLGNATRFTTHVLTGLAIPDADEARANLIRLFNFEL
ncbi:hypothetical protein SCLCIDRAFT_34813 [Scleroderma citrinum Foug A]|uniref:Uncharacterized protein n=1 Tax=Scleroderma citrinum Foug A TaxID=1036808 RepID=A0A0C2ZA51_9AGAM|nr:hypothetical protein SCLCIDRAFT_34813 [Scleroderma citrinum Foug A]